MPDNRHQCHARGCPKFVPPSMFMCKGHWFSLPKETRDEIWRVYVPGQEDRKDPTDEYLRISTDAIDWLAAKEAEKASS